MMLIYNFIIIGGLTNMPENMTKDRMKTIKKEIKELRKKYKIIEVRPCQNDAELLLKGQRTNGDHGKGLCP